jgi:NAD(P)-dependent dehydrogenase (short-subunit alcohol dehydrogenase family)
MRSFNRRRLLKSLGALAILATLPARLLAKIISAPPPHNDFDDNATAELVTEGLDLTGKTYLVTGANSGLGLETMRVLALRGAHVIGTARTLEKAKNACDSVSGNTTPEQLELTDFPSVVACAARVRAMNLPLDGLICNAGIVSIQQRTLVNGLEKHFVVNHLGHFILVNQLMDEVLRAKQGRFVFVSSEAHRSAPETGILFDDLAWENTDYDSGAAYGHSKLANALCSRELARRTSDTTATSNALHPGVIVTNAIRNMSSIMQLLAKTVGRLITKTIAEGAATQTYVATYPALVGVRGYYFVDCNPAEGTPYVTDDAMASRLWEVSEELTREYLPIPTIQA